MSNSSEVTERVEFFGLNGWSVVNGTTVVTRQFRTEAEALEALERRSATTSVVVAVGRDESEPCERGTEGCSVDHTNSAPGSSCETW